jgi:nanoRNase/pAp phosphatase (c-di-AMP/oligoRNAs hydrolase)
MKEFLGTLKALRGRTLVTFHSLGDVDAVASAIAVSQLLPRSEVAAVDGLSASARHLLTRLSLPLPRTLAAGELAGYDNIVFCDVSNADLLGGFRDAVLAFKGKRLLIDHHVHSKRIPSNAVLIESAKSSSCEVVYELFAAARKKPSEKTALLLAAGILHDSAFFKSAGKGTFTAFGHLLSLTRLSYSQVLALVAKHEDASERIARLKALQRVQVERQGDLVVGSCFSSAFELACATALVGAGCDVAFVANAGRGRISGVKRETLTGLSVGRVMEAAGRAMKGSGGGHENVGGAKGKPELTEKALLKCVEETLAKLKNQN